MLFEVLAKCRNIAINLALAIQFSLYGKGSYKAEAQKCEICKMAYNTQRTIGVYHKCQYARNPPSAKNQQYPNHSYIFLTHLKNLQMRWYLI